MNGAKQAHSVPGGYFCTGKVACVKRITLSGHSVSLSSPRSAGGRQFLPGARPKCRIAPQLMMAISRVKFRPNASTIGQTSDDCGLAPINSSLLPTLKQFGFGRVGPCIATNVSAWMLAQNMARDGHTRGASGAYNASEHTEARKRYAWCVLVALARFRGRVTQ